MKLGKGKGITLAKNVGSLILGGILLSLGIILLVKRDNFFVPAMSIVSILVIIGAVGHTVAWFLKKEKKKPALLIDLICLLLGVAMLCIPAIPQLLITILFAAYLALYGTIKLVDTILIVKNRGPELLFSLVPALFYWTFCIILLFAPLYHVNTVLIIVGIYCILLGSSYILDFIHSLVPQRTRSGIKRRIHISLPIFAAAFIPHFVLKGLNEFVSDGAHRPEEFEDINEKKEDIVPDLEMFIHVANDRFVMTVGHCDIYFDGEVVSYGNYDDASATSWGTGDGVLLIDKKETYIPFCLEFNKTTIFSFGLKLDEGQKERIRARIKEIKEQVYPWEPPYVQHKMADPQDAAARVYMEFSNGLCRADGAKFFKFHGGKFKTYFVMSTNCVQLADYIVCQAGTDIINISGIITPGAFYDYLESQFMQKGSMVVTRRVYSLDKNLGIDSQQTPAKDAKTADVAAEGIQVQ